MDDSQEFDLEYGDERDGWPMRYGFSQKGIRFYRFGLDEEDEDGAYEPPPRAPDGSDWLGPEVAAEASAAAAKVGALVDARGHWRCIPTGGAGDTGIVELIAIAASTAALIMNLLKSPGAAREAWNAVASLLTRMAASKKNDWHVGTEVAILKCLAEIQRDTPDSYTDPNAVRVIEDGNTAAIWADMPIGVHVIVIPDLKHEKTHIFAIDSQLNIHGRMVLDRLTSDAQNQ